MKLIVKSVLLSIFIATGMLTFPSATSGSSPIRVKDLPPPPKHVVPLLKRASVSWEHGPRDSKDVSPQQRNMAGQTEYRAEYSYRCKTDWDVNRTSNQITIRVHYSLIQWKVKHRIWLKEMPPANAFWFQRIVRHELDHVRISSDPEIATRFRRRLQEQPMIVRELESGQTVDQASVDRWVEAYVKQVFDEFSDLISIRYKELDRFTNHGQYPIPADSPVAKYLPPPEL